MSLFRFFSHPERGASRLLIDVGPSSVAGAYAAYVPGRVPALCYVKRVPITTHSGEPAEAAMERALGLICAELGKEGVVALGRIAGTSEVDEVIVSIDAPWQQTIVHAEEKREQEPFTFTRRTLASILERSRAALTEDADRVVEQHVVSVRLNGYETAEPFGKAARRATLLILISWIQSKIIETVRAIVREQFHRAHPVFISGPTLRYRVLSTVFPHERDMIILDAASHAGVLSLVRAGTLVAVQEFPGGDTDEEWVKGVDTALQEIAATYPLPHTILLVADGAETASHTAALQGAQMGAWLSKNPPRIIPISRMPPTQVTVAPETVPDIRLALMAQYVAFPEAED